MKRLLTALTCAFSALVLNPMIACQSEGEDDYSFDEADMRAVVVGTYTGTVTSTADTITVHIDEATAATISSRFSRCSTRSFIKPAEACAMASDMQLTAHVVSTHAAIGEAELSGSFMVTGTDLTNGNVWLSGPSGISLTATYDPDQGLHDWQYVPASASALTLELTPEAAP